MARVYTIPIDNVSIGTAVQDIIALKAGASAGIELHHIRLDFVATQAGNLRMRLKRGTATVTLGSGGTAPTPTPVNPNDAAFGGTAHLNDTSQATTSGAFTTLAGYNPDELGTFEYLPAPEDRESCLVNQAFILDLPSTITAVTISGFVKFAEIP